MVILMNKKNEAEEISKVLIARSTSESYLFLGIFLW